ncbi:5'/3'-nucleotidase SurE [Pseudochrobactrum asaccharolyticum]|uniref:5'/3'-nucleotidase SurE n=1 Tax=Pseudochrobactrum asaccharolyticum TaxID=354351 RepID=UPI004041D5AE
MRILISNDDGIDASGIAVLEKAARLLTDDVWIIAPDGNRSANGHCVSLTAGFSVNKVGDKRYACTGTPVDCVIAAVHWVFRDQKLPDLVLSGINAGRNVAEDVSYSGTMAVAREGSLNGIASVAFSAPRDFEAADTDALEWLASHIRNFWETRSDWAHDGHWLNVNLPRKLPAALEMAEIGRDKNLKYVTILEETETSVRIQPLADRDYTTNGKDENALIDAGKASVTNPNWFGHSPVPASVTAHKPV